MIPGSFPYTVAHIDSSNILVWDNMEHMVTGNTDKSAS